MKKVNDDLLGLNGNDGEALLFGPCLHDGLHGILGAAGRLQFSPQLRRLCVLGQKGENIICNVFQTISGSEKVPYQCCGSGSDPASLGSLDPYPDPGVVQK